MPEAFTGAGEFEDYLQQFTTTARLSGWQTATTDNRPNYFALRLKGNALHFYTTLTVAQQQIFDQLLAIFCTTYTTNVEVLEAKLKDAGQQPNQTITAFLCDVRTIARKIYRGQPLIEEQMVLTSFIESLHDSQLRWELRKSKPTPPRMLLWPSQSKCMLSWKWIPVSEVGPRPQWTWCQPLHHNHWWQQHPPHKKTWWEL